MPREKYTVFVSSTYEDLREEREQVIRAILEMGHIPVGMEMFSAGDEQQWALIKRSIDESDYYIVVAAHRYGSLAGLISYTEKEYDYAVQSKVPVLGFILAEDAKWPKSRIDTDPGAVAALARFKEKLRGRIVDYWHSRDQLGAKVTVALSKAISAYPRPGWVKADTALSTAAVTEVARLSKENADLRASLAAEERAAAEATIHEEEHTLGLLDGNSLEVSFYYLGEKDWSKARTVAYSRLFSLLAPELVVEKSVKAICSYLGAMLNDDKSEPQKVLRAMWPTPANTIRTLLADLNALGLACPSKRRHAVKDTEEYWSITERGLAMYARLRVARLEKQKRAADETQTKA